MMTKEEQATFLKAVGEYIRETVEEEVGRKLTDFGYRGVWTEGSEYRLGNFVTHDGSLFHCNVAATRVGRKGSGRMIDREVVAGMVNEEIERRRAAKGVLTCCDVNDILIIFVGLAVRDYALSMINHGLGIDEVNERLEAYVLEIDAWRMQTLARMTRWLEHPEVVSESLH
jgi:hypothetical protein